MIKLTRKKIVVLGTSGIITLIGLFIFRNHFSFNPFLVCIVAIPSEETVVDAIRYHPGDGTAGVGDDGRTWTATPLECPMINIMGDSSIYLLIRATEDGKVVFEQARHVWIIHPGLFESNTMVPTSIGLPTDQGSRH